jgi:cell division protease FtsH
LSSRLVRNSVVLVVLAVFGLALLWTYIVDNNPTTPYTYSQLLKDAQDGKIKSVEQDGTKLTVAFRDGSPAQTSTAPATGNVDVQEDICTAAGTPNKAQCADKITYNPVEESAAGSIFTTLLISLLPVLLIGAFIFFMMRQAQGTNNQAMSFGKSRARLFLGYKTVVTFHDVGGVDEA